MAHQRRRDRARSAVLLLGMLVVVALAAARFAAPNAAGATEVATGGGGHPPLEPATEPVYVALNAERRAAGLSHLELDTELVATAVRDACAVARGDVPLSGDRGRLVAAGGSSENLGLVIDDDPVAGAQTMNAWWARTERHRRTRMESGLRSYGIGACAVADRTYYVERFAR